jgi:hypothetical protein
VFTAARRYLVIIALLLIGVGLTWQQHWSSARNASIAVPTGQTASPLRGETEGETAGYGSAPGDPPLPQHVYFVDVEGWYRITPYERAVSSAYDLTGDTTEAIATALPTTIAEWHQVGPDRHVADDPSVVFYLKNPTVALERTYEDRTGLDVTLTLIGNKGEDSYLLFSHTPETCYPGRLWQVVEQRQESAVIDNQTMYAQYLLTQHAETGRKLMVLYWYLWDNSERDSREGVLSMRVNLFIPPDQTEEAALARAWDLIRGLFPTTVPWQRF